MHHSDPACVRRGADRGQVDISAAVIRVFERFGWATSVHWPDHARLAARRRSPRPDQPQPARQPGVRRTGRAAVPAGRLPLLAAGSDLV